MIRLIRLLLLGLLTGCQSCTDDPATSSASQDDSGALNVTPPNILIIDLAGLRSDVSTILHRERPTKSGGHLGHSIDHLGERHFFYCNGKRSDLLSETRTEASTWTLFKALGRWLPHWGGLGKHGSINRPFTPG